MPNEIDTNEAGLLYEGGDYRLLKNGSYVRCAVTGQRIPLNELKYWSIERQEAYADCRISFERELDCRPELRKLLA
ncbi:MAG: DUF2093 domain-containing protein [Candidatus Tokpelaia sp.]|uniref:DUF2093 domain-containing protein n=1 Tax=Candidatus Tokpelaia sp. TaxID=2233777 RepID=UPI00123AD2B9|nr:DUF2093 domain-containing protein [Candidatus Tokpelaia sp.]KAA6204374.1 MAG: DUF2093 domain-containing protein [Candidatus Tokpelaia sp.]KAA6206305.1 MAG: DUF2093 domain-containing protein [Candidatus Tokpelaia sp.]KAA6406257.1 DUF2093 domain-containing protein [Candidatus Tokpelaia sp.]